MNGAEGSILYRCQVQPGLRHTSGKKRNSDLLKTADQVTGEGVKAAHVVS